MDKQNLILSAAVAGIMAASMATSTAALAKKTEKGGSMVWCNNQSSCKGQGGCGATKGKNDCAGHGYGKMSKADCDAKGETSMPVKADGKGKKGA